MQGSCCCQWSFKEFKYNRAQPVDIYHATYQEYLLDFFNVFSVDLILHSHTFKCSPWGLHQGCRCCYSGLPFPPWACRAGRAAGNQLAMALVLSLLCFLHLVNPSCPLLAHYLLSSSLPAAWFLFPSWSQTMLFLIVQHVCLSFSLTFMKLLPLCVIYCLFAKQLESCWTVKWFLLSYSHSL